MNQLMNLFWESAFLENQARKYIQTLPRDTSRENTIRIINGVSRVQCLVLLGISCMSCYILLAFLLHLLFLNCTSRKLVVLAKQLLMD